MVPTPRKQPALGPKASLCLGQCMATAWHALLRLFTKPRLFALTCQPTRAAQKLMNLLPASWSSSSRSSQPQQQKALSVSQGPASKADDRQKLVDLHQLAKVQTSRYMVKAVRRDRESKACGLGAATASYLATASGRRTHLCSVPSCCSQLQRHSIAPARCPLLPGVLLCYVSVLQSSAQDPMTGSSWCRHTCANQHLRACPYPWSLLCRMLWLGHMSSTCQGSLAPCTPTR